MVTDLADLVLAGPARLGPVRAVAVDGPAAAGKTTFAGRLAAELRLRGVTVVEFHTDDLLDGWDDLLTFWPRLETGVLAPLRRGVPGSYRRYDWHRGRFETTHRPVPVTDVLVLEGVTSARAAIRPELTLSVFVTADRGTRLARMLDRDGAHLSDHLRRWMRVEAGHFAADRTRDAADVVVDGTADFVVAGGRRSDPAGGSGATSGDRSGVDGQ